MSDVINSIFGRANSGTSSPGGYAGAPAAAPTDTAEEAVTSETVDTDEIEGDQAETADSATEETDLVTEDDSEDEAAAVDTETAVVDDDADEVLEDEAEATDEAATDEDTAEDDSADTEADEVAEPTDADEVAVAAEPVAAVEAEVVDEAERVVAAAARPAAGTRGATTIGDDVVVKIVYRVASKADGVHELAAEDVEVAVDGDVATITISVVIEFGHAVKALAERIRVDVIEAVEQFLGLDVEGVDVHIADIHFPDAD